MNYSIKNVSSKEELEKAYDLFKIIFKGLPVIENPEYTKEKWYDRMIKNGDLMLYADIDGEIAGIVFGRMYKDTITIGPVAVEDKYRGLGIAKEMMCLLEDRVRGYGIDTINLGAVQSAENFYSKLGYKGALLVQSQKHSIEELLRLKGEYEVRFTNIYDGKVNQVCLELEEADRNLQKRYDTELPGSYTQMMYQKKLR